ncbi:MAG: hypothetical protein R8M46_00795 [Ghiorsea sp.]
MKIIAVLTTFVLLFVSQAHAGEKSFSEGKVLFQENCLVCHDAQLDPPQAPPMFAVQKKYKKATDNQSEFVNRMVLFVVHPTKDKALLKEPVKMLGLMPELGFSPADVKKVAVYIYDESFSPPCNHWKAAANRFKESGQTAQYRSHQKRFDMMCQQKSSKNMKPSKGASLKVIMQHLKKDYDLLTQAMLDSDFDGAAEAAHAIAYHDKAPMAQKKRLKQAFGKEMKGFKQTDMKVHALALSIEEAAKSKDMKLLVQRQSKMLGSCMACHSTYRERAIKILNR